MAMADDLLDKMRQIATNVVSGETTIDSAGYIYRSATVFGETMVIGIPPEVDPATGTMIIDLAEIIEQDSGIQGPQED